MCEKEKAAGAPDVRAYAAVPAADAAPPVSVMPAADAAPSADAARRKRLQAMEAPLLAWYQSRARVLPWRKNRDPYRIWVSEIMLQQTRVEAVKPYFERFMEAFPSVRQLAEADDDRLMKMWEGLGYYSRARNLKAAARIIVEKYGGCLPASFAELKDLPGIGSYTAGAVASIAYGLPVPAVDGNVLRVVSRILGDREDIKKTSVKTRMERELGQVIPKDEPGNYNQALFEVGALVCVPGGEPKCGECPLHELCLSGKNGWWREIPVKSAPRPRRVEERTVFLIEREDKVLIRRRPPKGLLASLYELPSVPGHMEREEALEFLGVEPCMVIAAKELPSSRHVFSHVEWHMVGCLVVLEREASVPDVFPGAFLADKKALKREYALPSAFSAYKRFAE